MKHVSVVGYARAMSVSGKKTWLAVHTTAHGRRAYTQAVKHIRVLMSQKHQVAIGRVRFTII